MLKGRRKTDKREREAPMIPMTRAVVSMAPMMAPQALVWTEYTSA